MASRPAEPRSELNRTPRRRRAVEWAAPCLLLVSPLVVFLRHQQYPLLAPETLLCLGGVTGFGLVLASLTALFGNYLRVPLFAILTTLFIDIQTDLISSLAGVAQALGLLLVAGLLLRRQLSALVCVVCGTLLVTSLLFPVSDHSAGTFELGATPQTDTKLPPVVHIIVDEFIGVEGIPGELDRDGTTASALKRFFLERDFALYGKAYAISRFSRTSIGTTMDFTVAPEEVKRFGLNRRFVGNSRYFEELKRRGYRIHVVESEHISFCRDKDGNPVEGVQSCFSYPYADLPSIGAVEMSYSERAKLVLGIYSQLSFGLNALQVTYEHLRDRPYIQALGLPRWSPPPLLSPLSTMQVFDRLVTELAEIQPGNAYLAHLLLPHYPYAYDEQCNVRDDPYSWLGPGHPGGNTRESRAVRYELYLAQLHCALKRLNDLFDSMDAAGRFDGTYIIVHGDHGSRITHKASMGGKQSNRVAQKSTLFAFHNAHAEAGGSYHSDLAPINLLLPDVLGVEGMSLDDRAFRGMPDFEAGRIRQGPGRAASPPAAE